MAEIPPASSPAKKGPRTVLIVVGVVLALGCCGIVPIFAAILFPVFSQAKAAAQRTRDLNAAKSLALAAIIYASDHDDRLPRAESWQERLGPYLQAAPGADEPALATVGGSSFEFQPALSDAALPRIAQPEQTPMFCPVSFPPTLWENDEYTVVGFADGHAKTYRRADEDALMDLIWEPEPAPESPSGP